jgi:hypothetical protein
VDFFVRTTLVQVLIDGYLWKKVGYKAKALSVLHKGMHAGRDGVGSVRFGLVEGDVIGPDAAGGGVGGGVEAGEGTEVVYEVGLVIVAAGEG